jgi:hypothetical protein
MSNYRGRIVRAVLLLAMVMGLVLPALGQRVVTVPVGTVIAVLMAGGVWHLLHEFVAVRS